MALPDRAPCWLVWKRADDGGRPYLVAVDTTEEMANLHVRAIRDEARVRGTVTFVQIEQSWTDHLYGESMGQGYDAMQALVREVKQVDDELKLLYATRRVLNAKQRWNTLTPFQAKKLRETNDRIAVLEEAEYK